MDAVKSFNQELAGLYEVKPPISKAKMTAITKGAIRAIKFYKHVVQSVEKFIQKCKTEYKIPGLYVIDSIVRQSRHQFGIDKDQFAPRFGKNILITFYYLFKCPQEDKSRIIRVLNLWQKNKVFEEDIIQPLFDLADSNHPLHKQISNQIASKNAKAGKRDESEQAVALQQQQLRQEAALQQQMQQDRAAQQQLHQQQHQRQHQEQSQQHREQRERGGTTPSESAQTPHQHPVVPSSVSSAAVSAAVPNLDPGLIQQIQQILMKQPPNQDDPTQGLAAAAAAATLAAVSASAGDYDGRGSLAFLGVDTSQPPPGYLPPASFMTGLPPQPPMAVPPPAIDYSQGQHMGQADNKPKSPREEGEHSDDDSDDVKEISDPEESKDSRRRSRSRSRSKSRRGRRRSSRSKSRSRSRSRGRRSSRSRSRGRRSSSRSRRRRSRSRDRERRDRDRDRDRERDRKDDKFDPEKEREKEKDREKDRERKKRGLAPTKKRTSQCLLNNFMGWSSLKACASRGAFRHIWRIWRYCVN